MVTGLIGLRVPCVPRLDLELLTLSLAQTRHRPKIAQAANKIVSGRAGNRGQLVHLLVEEEGVIVQE